MRGYELLEKMELVDLAYVEAADEKGRLRKRGLARLGTVAACLCLILSLTTSVLAAKVPIFYHFLYTISPATAQFFHPVQRYCEDNGIRMEVVATYIHEDTAEIYISMQDLEQSRIDQSMDLFDSYSIHTPFDCTSHCKMVSYDPNTRTATFLITIEQWNAQNIIGDKLTFSVREFLSNKQTYEGILTDVNLNSAQRNPITQTVQPRGLGGTKLIEKYGDSANKGEIITLKSNEMITSPVDGVALTSIGYINGNLHIQVYYEDIGKTDNHGFLTLKNKYSNEVIDCFANISFFDEERKGSYEDYVFEGIPAETLSEYEVYGEFTTSAGSIEGNWSVTFPLKGTSNK